MLKWRTRRNEFTLLRCGWVDDHPVTQEEEAHVPVIIIPFPLLLMGELHRFGIMSFILLRVSLQPPSTPLC